MLTYLYMDISAFLLNIAILLISAVAITKSIKVFVDSSTKIAHYFKLSEYTISFLLISIATSLPELVVAVSSGLEQNSILSYGDALGSNLALLTLVTALPVIFGSRLSTDHIVKSKDIYYGAFFMVLALALAVDGTLTRLDGGVLLAMYFFYGRAVLKRGTILEVITDKLEHINIWKQGVLFTLSLLLVLAASQGIVQTALNMSELFNVSLGYIGLTITALGTSLPEITFVLKVKDHQNNGEILGDVIGSVVANSTLVLGTAAMIYPIELGGSRLGLPTMGVLIATLILFIMFARTKGALDRKEALALLAIYIGFLGMEYAFLFS